MLARTLHEIAKIVGGRLLQGQGELNASNISTDSRALRPGELFFALRGDRFDGHQYIREAEAAQACGAIVSEKVDTREHRFPLIQVPDTLQALRCLASEERDALNVPVIAVTGSNGKSTTRSMLDRVLSSRYRVLAAEKSYNNQIGVSLTLLRNEPGVECVVLELGTNHPGEIGDLCGLCHPTMALMTNIGRSHLEFFGDERGVLKEKMVLPEWPSVEHAFYNADDPLLSEAFQKFRGGHTSFGTSLQAQVRATRIESTPRWGTRVLLESGYQFELALPGRHHGVNALAAIAVGKRLGIQDAAAAERLNGSKALPRRCEVKKAGGIWVVDDTYNANPSSIAAALELLADDSRQGRKIFVMGEMAELGEGVDTCHREVGRLCRKWGLDCLMAVGRGPALAASEAKDDGPESLSFENKEDCLHCLYQLLRQGDTVLVKGSRVARMDEFVDRLMDRLAEMQGMKPCSIS